MKSVERRQRPVQPDRGLRKQRTVLRPYQERLVSAVLKDVAAGVPEIVLAGACGSGKTKMACAVIRRLIEKGAVSRVLVLAHGTTVLRAQFFDVAKKEFGEAGVHEHVPGINTRGSRKAWAALYSSSAKVVVSLPQSLVRHAALPAFDLVIVDEAHEFYEAPMVKGLIAKIGAKSTVLLTGSPSKFIARGLPLHAISLHDVMRECPEAVCDPAVDLVSSEFLIGYDRYNRDGEMQRSFRFGRKATAATLDGLLAKMVQHLPRRRGHVVDGWRDAVATMGKTIVACRSIALGRQVVDYFRRRHVNAGLSTHENDLGSEEIRRFKDDASMALLIVVRRGVLGFDFPELLNLVDMTGTINIDRIFQMFARVVRPHPTKPEIRKLFVKMTPKGKMAAYTRDVVGAALQLGRKETFESFDGGNLDGVVIPRWRGDDVRIPGEDGGKATARKPRPLAGCFQISDFFEAVASMDDEFSPYAKTTLGRSRISLLSKSPGWGDTLCSFDGCDHRAKVMGLCHSHYAQQHRGESLRPIRRANPGQKCSFDPCSRAAFANGLCSGHNSQRHAGRPLSTLRQISPKGERPDCRFPGCGRVAKRKTLCESHRNQMNRSGSLRPIKTPGPRATMTAKLTRRIEEMADAGIGVGRISADIGIGKTTVYRCLNRRSGERPRVSGTGG